MDRTIRYIVNTKINGKVHSEKFTTLYEATEVFESKKSELRFSVNPSEISLFDKKKKMYLKTFTSSNL